MKSTLPHNQTHEWELPAFTSILLREIYSAMRADSLCNNVPPESCVLCGWCTLGTFSTENYMVHNPLKNI